MVSAIKLFIKNFQAANEVKIVNYYLDDGADTGSNMITGVNRLQFAYGKGQDLMSSSAILKVPSLGGRQIKNPEDAKMFDRELYMYAKVLPEIYESGQCEPFAPILYAANQARALVLEDLSEDGYKHQSKQFDLDHSLAALDMLATYHALGYKYLQDLNRHDPYILSLGSFQPTVSKEIKKTDFDRLCRMVEQPMNPSLYQKILKAENRILTDSQTKNSPKENSMTVIIHGDMHSKNIFFKYDNSGKICGTKIIDFQFSGEASPAVDLIEFFVLNVPFDIFEANENRLLDSYVTTLNQKLSSASANRAYSRVDLNGDLAYHNHHFFRVFSSLCGAVEQIIRMYGEQVVEKNNPIVSDIIQWSGYLSKKGFI